MIAALYVDPKGVYSEVPDVDLWDEARDARLYDGPWPVIAHPPCARWCQLAPLVEHVYGYKRGDDGGCFEAALAAVRRFGGVLEHPAYSLAWKVYELPRPTPGVWSAALDDEGWVCHFEQHAYGVTARKATWLYAVRCSLPDLKWGLREPKPAGGWWVGRVPKLASGGRLRGASASRTPPELRDVLVRMVRGQWPTSYGCLQVTRYREAFSWTRTVDDFVRFTIIETPLLNVCAGRSDWGDVSLDLYEPADVRGTWTELPFEDDSFGAVFADPPWDSGHKVEVAAFMREALRVAPVAYLMAPWLYCAAWAKITRVWWREFPGIHTPILLSRYERSRQLSFRQLSFPAPPNPSAPRG